MALSSRARSATRAALIGTAAGLGLALAVQVPAFADVIRGNANNNTLNGTAGGDTIYGYAGNDTLHGYGGADTLYGNSDNDKLYGGDEPDDLYGGHGSDYLFGGTGPAADRLFGGPGPDTLNGGPGDDVVKGDDGRDALRGEDGGDRIRARDGYRDRVTCEGGRDVAILDTRDLITDTSATRRKGSCESVRWPDRWRLPLPRNSFGGRDQLDDPHWSSTPAIDLQVPNGTQVYAVRGGHVTVAGWGVPDWCGMGVEIAGVSGGRYLYCHLRRVGVSAGQGISTGARIGRTGETGQTSGPHLHFAITSGSRGFVCPQRMLLAIWDGTRVPLPKDLPATGCTQQ